MRFSSRHGHGLDAERWFTSSGERRSAAGGVRRPGAAYFIGRSPARGTCGLRALGLVTLGLMLGGCGNAVFAIQASAASRNLEQARELGAETYAPYEYYYAEAHLRKAQSEAAEADYGDARLLARDSKKYALKAIEIARESHRGAGR